MSRADRLLTLLELLRGRDALTIAEIAAELDVSPRSVHRDLALLRARGLPISGESGPGGGVRYERDRGVAAVHLGDDEVVALWLSAHLGRVATELPWGRAARHAMEKLFASVPRERSRALRALCRRVVVGNAASPRVRQDAREPPAELLGIFERAFTAGVCLGFAYRDREGKESLRRVEPHGLLVEPPVWYVLAHDLDREAPRTFRMDRVSRPRLLADRTFRPRLEVVRALTTHLDEEAPVAPPG